VSDHRGEEKAKWRSNEWYQGTATTPLLATVEKKVGDSEGVVAKQRQQSGEETTSEKDDKRWEF
jgi:hypothetical protein